MLVNIIMMKLKKMLNKDVINLVFLLLVIVVVLLPVLKNTYKTSPELSKKNVLVLLLGAGPHFPL